MDEDKIKVAIKKSAQICSRKEMCIFDIKKKCTLWELNEDETDVVIQYLINEKYIDETRFVEFFCNDKIKFNKWGKIKVRHHLSAKSVSNKLVDRFLQGFDYDLYFQIAKELLIAKAKSVKYKDKYEFKIKLSNFAASRGFEYDIFSDIIDDIVRDV